MKSNYRKLGQYIQRVDNRNRDLSITRLLGVSIKKQFIPSIANIVGTDLSNYKIVRTGQFAYGPVTSRNGDKISIAYLDSGDCIISSSYTVFEVRDKKKLDPEYLMLWFNRPEFDRYARYKSHGSVREIFDWNELCNVELPVPPLKKQQKIVSDYNALTRRIALKKQINDHLVALGVASIQKNIGKGALINLSESEIAALALPDGFTVRTISEFCVHTKSGATPSRANDTFWKNGTIPWVKSGEVHNNITFQTEELISQAGLEGSSAKQLPKGTVLMAMYGVTAGEVGYLAIDAATNQAVCGMICASKADAAYLYFVLIQSQDAISRLSNGGAQNNLSKNFIDNIRLVVPPPDYIDSLKLTAIIDQMTLNTKEIAILEELQSMICIHYMTGVKK